jgi:hypothetical protein
MRAHASHFISISSRVGCRMHARRRFFGALRADPERAQEVRGRTRALYAVERDGGEATWTECGAGVPKDLGNKKLGGVAGDALAGICKIVRQARKALEQPDRGVDRHAP